MQASKFNQLIKSPFHIEKESIADLEQLVNDFPYFQSAHILLNLAAKRWDANLYQKHLKKTAILVSNRSHLFKLIHAQENIAESNSFITKEAKAELLPTLEQEASNSKEAVQEELDILKATELAQEQKIALDELQKTSVISTDMLEPQIAKEVVASIVDKEIINKEIQKNEVMPQEEVKPESFNDWLSFLKKNNGQTYKQIEKRVNDTKEQKQSVKALDTEAKPAIEEQLIRKQKNKALIDKIIDSNPGSIKIKEEQKFYSPDTKAKQSLLENEHLVTETLAKIYALQGNNAKAIRAYEILSLKFPQKSVYFATLIQKLKNNT